MSSKERIRDAARECAEVFGSDEAPDHNLVRDRLKRFFEAQVDEMTRQIEFDQARAAAKGAST